MKTLYPAVFLKPREERRLNAGHSWIFSNEIRDSLKSYTPGELVTVFSAQNQYLGVGYINPHSLIAVRLLTRTQTEINPGFIDHRINAALNLRERMFPDSRVYRLIFGESDGLPGIVVDRYDDICVIQSNTAGADQLIPWILDAIEKLVSPRGILIRRDSTSRDLESISRITHEVRGEVLETHTVVLHHLPMSFPVHTGQKTGLFLDQQDNYSRLSRYIQPGARVFDGFCYVGGWGLHALKYGADSVAFADTSGQALGYVEQNVSANRFSGKADLVQNDVRKALHSAISSGHEYDLVIIDPPAFIKSKKHLRNGIRAYEELNNLAMQILKPGGILVSCSCSYHLGSGEFLRIIARAASKTAREIKLLELCGQSRDHPVLPAMPETSYLKVGFLQIN